MPFFCGYHFVSPIFQAGKWKAVRDTNGKTIGEDVKNGSCSEMCVCLFSQITAIEQEALALSCARIGLGWISGKISSPKVLLCSGPGCPGRWCSHCPWRCSRVVWMWHRGHGQWAWWGWAGGWTR